MKWWMHVIAIVCMPFYIVFAVTYFFGKWVFKCK